MKKTKSKIRIAFGFLTKPIDKKLYLYLFFLLSTFTLNTNATTSNCQQISEINWPDELIYLYFNAPGTKIIALPSSYCKTTGEIQIKNIENKTIGNFKISTSILSKYNDNILNSKLPPKMVLQYHDTLSTVINPYVFTDFIFKFFNKRLYQENKEELLFLEGKFTLLTERLKNNPYVFSQKHWNAININYKELIQFYLKPNVIFISLKDDDGYFFPGANEYDQEL
jgi:hypothetical protein